MLYGTRLRTNNGVCFVDTLDRYVQVKRDAPEYQEILGTVLILLAPVAPHLMSELWAAFRLDALSFAFWLDHSSAIVLCSTVMVCFLLE
jgi:leucyl-tRNA synthetase